MEGWNLARLSTKTVLTKLPTRNSFIHITSASHLHHHGTQPNNAPATGKPNSHYPVSYTSLFQACRDIKQLRQIHAHILTLGLDQDIYLLPKLVSKYTIYGGMDDALLIFDKTMKPNVYIWSAMISGCIRNGLCEQALSLYRQMQEQGIEPDSFIFSSVVKACADLSVLQEGMGVHDDIVRIGLESDIVVSTALVAMYAKCGVLEIAREVFDKMYERNVVSWSAMIAGYSQKGYAGEALRLFNGMRVQGFEPDLVIMVSVLPAFSSLLDLQHGKCIHGYVIRSGFESDFAVSTALIDMYAKCGSVGFARQLFDNMCKWNVGLWNAMIAGYTHNGYANEALELFNEMQVDCVEPDLVTIVSIVPACANLSALQLGKWIHSYIIVSGFELDVMVGTALIDMYAKCGSVEIAWKVFDRMSQRNVVSWNAMIAGYAQNGHADEALALFNEMQLRDLKPDSISMVNTLPACAFLSALQQGKRMHGYIIRSNFESDIVVCNSLVDMYAKCGTLEFARQLFDNMSERTVVSWNTMIGGYGMHGHGEDALALFAKMEQEGMKPDHVTFISVLSACSHAGLVDDGWQCFVHMIEDCSITPSMEHYACMVDLLGRSGLLHEAYDFIQKMPFKPNAVVWGGLLGACRIHGDILLGEYAMNCIFELVPENAAHYVMLSNIYAEAGRWDVVAKLRNTMKVKGLKKTPGCSWIEGMDSNEGRNNNYKYCHSRQLKKRDNFSDSSLNLRKYMQGEQPLLGNWRKQVICLAQGLFRIM